MTGDRAWATPAVSASTPVPSDVGSEMHELVSDLYPLCRSIAGQGLRETLRRLQKRIPLEVREVPSGTRVFDWVIPREWNIREAWVENSRGERVIDFQRSNLHVVGYSAPVRARMPLAELKRHLHTLPERPEWIPYRTSYFRDGWGFCLSHARLLALDDGEYEVCIDSTLAPGSLTYGECFIEGETADEVLISAHVCHPSLANDNLSGVVLATRLAEHVGTRRPRYSYRFVFAPATIGALAWLSDNEARVSRVKHGLVLACVGDPGKITYKRSRRGDAEIDRAVLQVLRDGGEAFDLTEFVPFGYDERQYCSPAFDLPVGCLARTPHGQFPEYHTSADDLTFVRPEALADSFTKASAVLALLEGNRTFVNLAPKGEPQLGRRGLYQGYPDGGLDDLAVLWVLNLSDGAHSLLDIAERSGMTFALVRRAADRLVEGGLLRERSE